MPTTLTLAFGFPDKLPAVVGRQSSDGSAVVVTIDAAGRVCVNFADTTGATNSAVFQPIHVRAGDATTLIVGYSANKISVHVGSLELLPRPSDPPVVVAPNKAALPLEGLVYPGIDFAHIQRDPQRLFLDTVADIDAKTAAGGRYDLLRSSGMLRQLFLEGLVHEVNRDHRQRLEFEIVDIGPPPKLSVPIVSFWKNIEPSFAGDRVQRVRLDQLLAVQIFGAGSTQATVRDVIRAWANAKGGVHYGSTKHDGEILVLEFDDQLRTPLEPSLVTLRGLCKILLRGIRPLVRALIEAG
jgi:hypothetical protein